DVLQLHALLEAIEPRDARPPRAGPQKAHQDAQRGRLARAVRAQEGEHLALLQLQIHVPDRAEVTVALAQALDHQHRAVHHWWTYTANLTSVAADARGACRHVVDVDAGHAALHAHAAQEELGLVLDRPPLIAIHDGRSFDPIDPEGGVLTRIVYGELCTEPT